MTLLNTHVACRDCPVGAASGAGRGGFCPFIDRRWPANATIYGEGWPADRVWYVKEGTVVLSRHGADADGPGRVRAVRFAGSFIGLEAMIGETYFDSARAVSAAVLCGITRDGLDTWLGPPGNPARTALELTLRTQRDDLLPRAAADGTAVRRVAAWLHEHGPSGVTLALPRRVVAELLGMRAETFSRALASLSEYGAISTTRTELSIVDAEALARLASGPDAAAG
jgi:CRP-like cAMP-binding protein